MWAHGRLRRQAVWANGRRRPQATVPPQRGGGPAGFHRTRCLVDCGQPCCEARGGKPAEGSQDLRRGGKNAADHRRVLLGFADAAATSTVEKLHGVDVATQLWNELQCDEDVLNPTSPLGREWFSSHTLPSNPLLPLRGGVYPSPYPLSLDLDGGGRG